MELTQFQADLPQTDDFLSLVLKQTPLMDVRAPVEFQQGAFESAHNLPLMDDDQRQQVGICYKQQGNEAAVKLGHQLISGDVKQQRIQDWQAFIQHHPDAMLYCFRGGMRSKIVQQWLADQGIQICRLKGGYKAFRRYLFDYLEAVPVLMIRQQMTPWVLAGRTGSGKTLLLKHLENAIDLEALANHRGSAFGRHVSPQPTQINFENQLAMALIRFMQVNSKTLVVEDESANIGSVYLPKSLHQFLKSGERLVLEASLDERIEITFEEYVVQAQLEYPTLAGWAEFMENAFRRIRKRLGDERYQRVLTAFHVAYQQQLQNHDASGHTNWIAILLGEYYDPMYDYQMKKHPQTIRFQGGFDEVVAYLQHLNG